MKLAKEYEAEGAEVPYLLDTGDGQYSEGAMRASVAEEIVRGAETVDEGGVEGFEIAVNNRMMFPASAFEPEEGERHPAAKRKSGRPTKAELLQEAGETMTNPEIHEAIEESRARKASKGE